jgi:hypothetical protein
MRFDSPYHNSNSLHIPASEPKTSKSCGLEGCSVWSLYHNYGSLRVDSVDLGDRRGDVEEECSLKIDDGLLYRTLSLQLEEVRVIC